MQYFPNRGKKLTHQVTPEFWTAFTSYIEEIDVNLWLYEKFGYEERFSFVTDSTAVNRKMAQDLGCTLYPLFTLVEKPKDAMVFGLIEFFFSYISIPEFDVHPPDTPPEIIKFDTNQARYEYTIRINELFDNFRLSYKVKRGIVGYRHSEYIDKVIANVDFDIPGDPETKNMLNTAISKFYSRDFEEQKIALEKLVDAYQRISSWENSNNKGGSIKNILKKISEGDEEIEKILGEDCRKLWQTANTFLIRHTERDKIPINDKDVLEYLFYAYFNVIRFILKKYGYITEYIDKKKQEEDFEGTPPAEDEELPF